MYNIPHTLSPPLVKLDIIVIMQVSRHGNLAIDYECIWVVMNYEGLGIPCKIVSQWYRNKASEQSILICM